MLPTYLMQLVLWQVIPPLLTNFILRALHSFLGPPPSGSRTAQQQYQLVYTLIMLGYLGYTFWQAASAVPSNWFQLVGASVGVEKEGLQKAFRRFAVKYHPDRAGKGAEDLFVIVRQGYEALQNPAKRFAYEKFGDDMLPWAVEDKLETLVIGLKRSVGFYIVATLLMGVMKINSGGKDVMLVWRGFIIILCAALEFFIVLHPTPMLLSKLFTNTLPWQYVDWLHQVSMSVSAGLGHIAPVWKTKEVDQAGMLQEAMRVMGLLHNDVTGMIKTDLQQLQAGWDPTTPPLSCKFTYPADEKYSVGMLTHLEDSMIFSVLENRVVAHPQLRGLWNRLVRRSREEQDDENVPLALSFANGKAVTPEPEAMLEELDPAAIPLPESRETSVVLPDSPVRHGSVPPSPSHAYSQGGESSSPKPGLGRTVSSSHLPSPEPE